MLSYRKCVLVVGLLLGCFHTGTSITCYSCTEITGAAAKDKPPAPCLNTNAMVCPSPDIKHCYRMTTIKTKPVSAELNVQMCAAPGDHKAECSQWTPYEHGAEAGQTRECYCTGDKCNAAAKGSGYPSSLPGMCIVWLIVVVSRFAKS